MPDKTGVKPPHPKPFWSGNIVFGLLNLPVHLFVAKRSGHVRLRMVDDSGTPLRRRYFCPRHRKALTADEIARGYEVGKERFVVVEDRELDAAAPEKSREIELRRFVALSEIEPVYFNRTYFLVPGKGAAQAYRLLARSMQDERRAGIATFVMRGKEHPVAIIAEKDILHAETLRFHDELRTPEGIGLPPVAAGDRARVRKFTRSINSRTRKSLNPKHLRDSYGKALRQRIDDKLKAGEDVLRVPEATEEAQAEPEGGDSVVDLMQVLKDSLQEQAPAGTGTSKRRSSAESGSGTKRSEKTGQALNDLPKTELYHLAQELDISGRSQMTKPELIAAVHNRG